MVGSPRLSPHTSLHTHATQQNNCNATSLLPATNAKRLRKGAIATKQSIYPSAARWIASLRSQ
jgi:hypothetical protein